MADLIIPPQNPPSGGDDKLSKEEDKAFKIGRKLDEEAAEKDFDHKQLTKSILAWVIRLLVVVLGLALSTGIVVWSIHLLAPECWRWLSQEEITQIQHLMTSALLGMVASEYARRSFT